MNKEAANKKRKITLLKSKTNDELINIILRKDEIEKKKDKIISDYKDQESCFRSLIDKKNATITSHNKEIELYSRELDEKGFKCFKLKCVALVFAIGLIAALVIPLL